MNSRWHIYIYMVQLRLLFWVYYGWFWWVYGAPITMLIVDISYLVNMAFMVCRRSLKSCHGMVDKLFHDVWWYWMMIMDDDFWLVMANGWWLRILWWLWIVVDSWCRNHVCKATVILLVNPQNISVTNQLKTANSNPETELYIYNYIYMIIRTILYIYNYNTY